MCQKLLLLLLNLSVTAIAYEVRPRSQFIHCTKGRTVSPGYCTSDKGILARCFQATKNANDANCAAACAKDQYCEYYSVGKGSYAGHCVLFGANMQRNVNSKMANCYSGDTGHANSHGTYLSTWNSCIQMQCTNFYNSDLCKCNGQWVFLKGGGSDCKTVSNGKAWCYVDEGRCADQQKADGRWWSNAACQTCIQSESRCTSSPCKCPSGLVIHQWETTKNQACYTCGKVKNGGVCMQNNQCKSNQCRGARCCDNSRSNGCSGCDSNGQCNRCRNGYGLEGSSCRRACADGQFLRDADTCSDCQPGFACPDRTHSITCGQGTYSNSLKSTKCKECEAGTYQPRTGQRGCQSCPAGRYGTHSGMVSEHQCEECASCPIGQYRSGCGGGNPGKCSDCTRPASDEYFTGSGGSDPNSCPTAKIEILEPGCTNVGDCAAWYQGDMFATMKFGMKGESIGMNPSFSLVPQGKPDMGIRIAKPSYGLSGSPHTFEGVITVPYLQEKDGDDSPSFYQLRIDLTKFSWVNPQLGNFDGQVDRATAYSKPFPVRSLGDTFERNYYNALQALLKSTHLLGRVRRRLQSGDAASGKGFYAVLGQACAQYTIVDASEDGCSKGYCGIERCAAVVQKLGKSRGCNGNYFFYSADHRCSCPTDECDGSANADTSHPGQLYEFSTQMETVCAARRPEGLDHVVCNKCAVHVHRACDCIDNVANGIDCMGIDSSVSVATLKVTDSALTTDLDEWMNKLDQDDQRYEQKDRFEKIEARIEKARVESYMQGMQSRLDDLIDAEKKQVAQLQASLDKVKVAITLRKAAMEKVHNVFGQLKSAFPDEANHEKSTLTNLRQELTNDINKCAVVAKKHEIFGFLKAGINFGVGLFAALLTQNYVGAGIAGVQGVADVLNAADKYKSQLDKLQDVKNEYGLDVQIPSPFDGTPCAGKLEDKCETALAWAHSHGLDSISGNYTHLDINEKNSWITKFLDNQEIHWLSKLSPEKRDKVQSVYAKAEEVKKNLDKAADAVANMLKLFKDDKACKEIDTITTELDHHRNKLLVVKNQINALRSVFLAIQALDSVNFEDLITGPRPTSGLDQLDPQDAMEGLKYYGNKEVQLAAEDKSEDMQAQRDSKLVQQLSSAFADVVQTDHDFFSTMQEVRNGRRQVDIARTAVARARKDLKKQQDIDNDIEDLQSKWKLQAAVIDQHWHARNTTVLRIRVLIRQKYLALKYECLQVKDSNFNFCDSDNNPTYDCLNALRRAIDEEYKKCKDARSQSDKGQQQVALNLPLDKTIYDEQTRTASFCLRPPNMDVDEQCQATNGDKYSDNGRFYYDVRLNSHQDHFQVRAWFLGVGIDGSAQQFQTTVTRMKSQSWFFDKCKQLHFFSLHDRTWTTTSSYTTQNKCQQIGHALDGQDAYVNPSPYGCYQVSLGAVSSTAHVSVAGLHIEFDLIVKEGGVGASVANEGRFFADVTHDLGESSLVTGDMSKSTRHVGCSNTPAIECAAVKQLFCNPSSPTLGEDQCDSNNCRFCLTNVYPPVIGNVCQSSKGLGDGNGVVVVHGRRLRGSEESV